MLAVNPDDNDTRSLQALVVTFDSDGERLIIGTAQGAIYKVDLLAFRWETAQGPREGGLCVFGDCVGFGVPCGVMCCCSVSDVCPDAGKEFIAR